MSYIGLITMTLNYIPKASLQHFYPSLLWIKDRRQGLEVNSAVTTTLGIKICCVNLSVF